jgi:integrase
MGWRLHDLRRTARSLLSRAGVAPDVGERCVAHAITGIRSVYDHHDFRDEKADAFERLASLVDRIINPPPANVVTLRREEQAS